jgi:diguanylate cyclase (GGDEF)-like protein/PAS domain S-box-containing protein
MALHFSLKTKMSAAAFLLVTGILLAGGFSLLTYFEFKLKESISDQQFTLVFRVAEDLDVHIAQARDIIAKTATGISPAMLDNPDLAQTYLDSRFDAISPIFDNGIFLFSATGILIAESPFLPDRRGKDYAFREYFRKTVESRQPYISSPYFSSQAHNHPAINCTAPIRNDSGEIIGVLAGSIDLTQDNMLGRITRTRIGKSGYLYLYATDRTMIMHPDPTRILKQDVPPGANRLFDRAIDGFEGSGETVNSRGLHALASFKRLRTVDWILAANYPVEEAFAPIRAARAYFYIGLAMALLLATLVVWLVMRRLTEPLLRFTRHVDEVTTSQSYREPLQVATRDEIATLAGSFNRLMAEVEEQKRVAREQLSFLQTLIDTIPNPIYYKNLEGQYLGCNRAFEKLYGRDREQIIGKTLQAIAPAEMAASLNSADVELYRQQAGQFQIFESTLRFEDGFPHDVLFYKAVFNDAEGRPAGLVGTIVDISERKASEIALAEQREFSENLLQNSAVPCFVIDVNHKVLTWTRACEELTGVAATEVLGSDRHWHAFYPKKRPCLADLIIDGDLEQTVELYESFADLPFIPEGLRAEGWFPDIGGKRRYLLFEAAPIRDSSGALIAAIETFHDLTGLKQIERALRESEQSSRSLIERSPDAIVVHCEGKVVFVNQAAARLFAARTPEDMAGIEFAELVHPDYRGLVQQRVARVEFLQEDMPYIEEKILRLDGAEVDTEVGSTPVFYGGHWAVQTILRDISERKEIQERIWRQANYDTLTGIPNRMLFLDRLTHALDHAEREKQRVALLFIDLDHFKEVNDTLGHAAGDTLLQEVTQRLGQCLRKTATLARMGGDEFTVILPGVGEPAVVKLIVERMLQRLSEPFRLPGGEVNISGSIGIVFYPKGGKDAAILMKHADRAMYQAKEKGRNGYCFYSSKQIFSDEPLQTEVLPS